MQNLKCKITIQNSKIISNEKIGKRYFKIIIESPQICNYAQPGQFLQVKVHSGHEPLLRRPFSIHRVMDSKIEILYEVVGKGTEILSQKRAGEYLDIIGPLGKGFNYQPPATSHQPPVLVAGGMGVAPLLFLAEQIRVQGSRLKAQVLIGAKTKSYILCEKEFRDLGYQVKIATDNGSKGFKGKVTDLLKNILPLAISHKPLGIYACGPKPMLKEIAFISQQYNIPAQVSLDEHMACGIGACLGCVVNTKQGFKRCCKDGPIFNTEEIIL